MPVYMKLGDIKGDVVASRTEATMVATELLAPGGTPQPVGLLLPAVQKVREAASRSTASTMGPQNLQAAPQVSQLIGLLLPAVQKVREAASRGNHMGPGGITSGGNQTTGLLLPAVQKVREAASRSNQMGPGGITSGANPTAALLLPAVQKVREAAARNSGGAVALQLHSMGSAGILSGIRQSKVVNVTLDLPDGTSVVLSDAVVFDVNPSGKGLDVVIGFRRSQL